LQREQALVLSADIRTEWDLPIGRRVGLVKEKLFGVWKLVTL